MPSKKRKNRADDAPQRAQSAVYRALDARVRQKGLSVEIMNAILLLNDTGGDPRQTSWYHQVQEFYDSSPDGTALHQDVRDALKRILGRLT